MNRYKIIIYYFLEKPGSMLPDLKPYVCNGCLEEGEVFVEVPQHPSYLRAGQPVQCTVYTQFRTSSRAEIPEY